MAVIPHMVQFTLSNVKKAWTVAGVSIIAVSELRRDCHRHDVPRGVIRRSIKRGERSETEDPETGVV